MTREEFWEWMETCPAKENGDTSGWFLAEDMGEECRIFFYFEIEETDDE
jgi:hypothetical protein